MKAALPYVSAVLVLTLAVVCVKGHSDLIRMGYRLSKQERIRDRLLVDGARARDRVGRLSSPSLLAERARELGLATEYPREYPVVRLGSRTGEGALAVVRDR